MHQFRLAAPGAEWRLERLFSSVASRLFDFRSLYFGRPLKGRGLKDFRESALQIGRAERIGEEAPLQLFFVDEARPGPPPEQPGAGESLSSACLRAWFIRCSNSEAAPAKQLARCGQQIAAASVHVGFIQDPRHGQETFDTLREAVWEEIKKNYKEKEKRQKKKSAADSLKTRRARGPGGGIHPAPGV